MAVFTEGGYLEIVELVNGPGWAARNDQRPK